MKAKQFATSILPLTRIYNKYENKIFHKILCVLGLLLSTITSYASEGCIEISHVPYTIRDSGEYCLVTDLTTHSRTAIFVEADDVFLDFAGHEITTTNAPIGVMTSGVSNIVIANGILNHFNRAGVLAMGGSSILVYNMNIRDVHVGFMANFVRAPMIINSKIINSTHAMQFDNSDRPQILTNEVINAELGVIVTENSKGRTLIQENTIINTRQNVILSYSRMSILSINGNSFASFVSGNYSAIVSPHSSFCNARSNNIAGYSYMFEGCTDGGGISQ